MPGPVRSSSFDSNYEVTPLFEEEKFSPTKEEALKIEERITEISGKICAYNPSKSTFYKVLRHTWVWIKKVCFMFWEFLNRRNGSSKEWVYVRTADGYLYQPVRMEKEIVVQLKENGHFPLKKGGVKVENPSGFVKYLHFLRNRQSGTNPQYDPSLHSGNVLQILESAQELQDRKTLAYCTSFLITLIDASNREDFLALARKYELEALETALKEDPTPIEEAASIRNDWMRAKTPTEIEEVYRDLQEQLEDTSAPAKARTQIALSFYQAALERTSLPTSLSDLMARKNTRIDLSKIAASTGWSLSEWTESHYRVQFLIDQEGSDQLFQLFVRCYLKEAYTCLQSLFDAKVSLKARTLFIQGTEHLVKEFLMRPSSESLIFSLKQLWNRECSQALSNGDKEYLKQLLELMARYAQEDLVANLSPLLPEETKWIEDEVARLLGPTFPERRLKECVTELYLLLAKKLIERERGISQNFTRANLFFELAASQSALGVSDKLAWSTCLRRLGRGIEAKEKFEEVVKNLDVSSEEEGKAFIEFCQMYGKDFFSEFYTDQITTLLGQASMSCYHTFQHLLELAPRFPNEVSNILNYELTNRPLNWPIRSLCMKVSEELFQQPQMSSSIVVLWKKEFSRFFGFVDFFQNVQKYCQTLLQIFEKYSPRSLGSLLRQLILGMHPALEEEVEKLFEAECTEDKLTAFLFFGATKLFQNGLLNETERFCLLAAAGHEMPTAFELMTMRCQLQQGKKRGTRRRLKELAEKVTFTSEENTLFVSACSECAKVYDAAYRRKMSAHESRPRLRKIADWFTGSNSLTNAPDRMDPDFKAALELSRLAFRQASDPETKRDLFLGNVIPYFKELLPKENLEKKLWKLGEQFVRSDHPAIAVEAYLEVMRLAIPNNFAYFQEFDEKGAFENLAVSVKFWYLQNPGRNAPRSLKALNEALNLIGKVSEVIVFEDQDLADGWFNSKTETVLVEDPFDLVVSKTHTFAADVGASLHFLKGEILSHQPRYSRRGVLEAFRRATNRAPNNPFGALAPFLIDNQSSTADSLGAEIASYRSLAIQWGAPVVGTELLLSPVTRG